MVFAYCLLRCTSVRAGADTIDGLTTATLGALASVDLYDSASGVWES
jgi:hypothetical protein